MTLDEYRALKAARKAAEPRRNDNPEHRLQCAVALWLEANVLPPTFWSADAAGVRVSPGVAAQMRAAGVNPGWPDLRFLCPDGVTRYIELKPGSDGSLSPAQRAFRDAAKPHGIWALCRTLEAVKLQLRAWGVPLADPEAAPLPRRARRGRVAAADGAPLRRSA